MNRTVKTWLIIAVSLIGLGLISFAGVMVAYNRDFSRLSTMEYVTNTYEVDADFDKMLIDVSTTKVELVPSDDEQCKVVCTELEKVKHSAIVQDGVLTISTVDTRKWYEHIGIFIGTMKITVYLPQNEYDSLLIDTDTGNIDIPKDFAFENIEIKGDTSDVVCLASVSNVLEIRLSTGDITVEGSTAGDINLATTTGRINVDSVASKGNIDIETDTGKVKLSDVACIDFSAESETGTIIIENVVAKGSFFITTGTGDVRFKDSDAAEISIETSTGDVIGTLLSEKVFITKTSTGRVNVPKTITGGKCEITTSTGDIEITIIP